jgi:A/G-specific adenine glycosylase
LLNWYRRHRRHLPWRERPHPYLVLVSEFMLQQTQMDTVLPYFRRFIRRFPSFRALAMADEQDVLKAWEGLGYYSRARNLHGTAKAVVSEYRGRLPAEPEALRRLPGVGEYMAGAVASIAFNRRVPAVDGNVMRVFARFNGIETDIRKSPTRAAVRDFLEPVLRRRRKPGAFNQAIMELGALVCRPRRPRCDACPLRRDCQAFASGRTDQLPVVTRRPPVPHHNVSVGLVWRGDRILVVRRRTDQMLGGLWELPGGRRRKNEAAEACVRRKLQEKFSVSVRITGPGPKVLHAYSHFRVTLTAFHCVISRGRARMGTAAAILWIRPGEIAALPFGKAALKVLDSIGNGSGTRS